MTPLAPDTIRESFNLIRANTPEAIHELVGALERRLTLNESLLALQDRLNGVLDNVVEMHHGHSVRVPDDDFNPDDYPINRGTPAHDLDGYALDDPKRISL